MSACSVFLVEDDHITLASLSAKIRQNSHLALVGAVSTCKQALVFLAENDVDVLLTDLDLPDGDGAEIITAARSRQPSLLAMVISVFGDERHVLHAIQAGASGYLLKDGGAHEIGDAISQLVQGHSPISPTIAHHLIKALQPIPCRSSELPELTLSERELEVLTLAAKGFTYSEIAEMIDVSASTVSTYTRRVYTKLSVNSKSQAIYEASRMGLMDGG